MTIVFNNLNFTCSGPLAPVPSRMTDFDRNRIDYDVHDFMKRCNGKLKEFKEKCKLTLLPIKISDLIAFHLSCSEFKGKFRSEANCRTFQSSFISRASLSQVGQQYLH